MVTDVVGYTGAGASISYFEDYLRGTLFTSNSIGGIVVNMTAKLLTGESCLDWKTKMCHILA